MQLSSEELVALFKRVFNPVSPRDDSMTLLVDLPDEKTPDHKEWAARRAMADGWRQALAGSRGELGMDVVVYVFPNVGRNNADLPETFWPVGEGGVPASASELDPSAGLPRDEVLEKHPIHVALTEFSATAPLKVFAREHAIRAATMPGFRDSMIPALKLDYGEIGRRVEVLTKLLNRADKARLVFDVDHTSAYHLTLDLRHRKAHASKGLFPAPGQVGNLPSGEAYIVPYEGERSGDPSKSEGYLPVQFGQEVVVYEIRRNVAVSVTTRGEASTREGDLLRREPAYGNLSELGLGVLGPFGLEPTGEILLDEKLGLHIAFGRSDHFGGQVSPESFKDPENVIHIDRVYVPKIQPKVSALSVDLYSPEGKALALIRNNDYSIDFSRDPDF